MERSSRPCAADLTRKQHQELLEAITKNVARFEPTIGSDGLFVVYPAHLSRDVLHDDWYWVRFHKSAKEWYKNIEDRSPSK